MTPMQIWLLSALGGAGTFGSIRLLQDAMRASKPRDEVDSSNNELKIDLPQAGAPFGGQPASAPGPQQTNLKLAVFDWMKPESNLAVDPSSGMPNPTVPSEGGIGESLARYAAVPLGIIPGFLGAKYLYDKYQANRGQKEIDGAKQRYLQALQQASMKNAAEKSDTPYVDGFCEVLKEAMTKEGRDHSVLSSLIGSLPFSDSIGTAGGVMAGGTALAVLGAMIMADRNKQKAKTDKSFPEHVVLNNQPPSTGSQLL